MAEVKNPASGDLGDYCREVARRARVASRVLAQINGSQKNEWLLRSAERIRASQDKLREANERDLDMAPSYGLTDAQTDRLRLTDARVESIAVALDEIAGFPDPIGQVIESTVRPNGLHVQKVRVPLGVVFFVYESRPNVTVDAAAICVKSGNAVILRGGKEAAHSSRALVDILNEVAGQLDLPADAVQLVSTTDRDAVGHFLSLSEHIDVAIPRGGEGLIRRVASEATMPVIKHFAGNCHVYIDQHADPALATRLTVNSKCQRLGVCNAAESLLVHAAIADQILPAVGKALRERKITLRGDGPTCQIIPEAETATDEDYSQEYLGPIISIRVVPSINAAIEHINRYGSGHTDAIITRDLDAARQFAAGVDSSAVMVNASTRFNDGGEFGLGAEIGISTDKFHARGPCGPKELTSYKYVVFGDGQIRQ